MKHIQLVARFLKSSSCFLTSFFSSAMSLRSLGWMHIKGVYILVNGKRIDPKLRRHFEYICTLSSFFSCRHCSLAWWYPEGAEHEIHHKWSRLVGLDAFTSIPNVPATRLSSEREENYTFSKRHALLGENIYIVYIKQKVIFDMEPSVLYGVV